MKEINNCERYIYEETPQMEAIRHKLSALLMDTNEENPMLCDVTLEVGAQGLSEAEKAKCVSAFQDYEGIIWFNLEGQKEPIEFDDMCYDEIINSTNLEDVERVLNYLLNN